MVLRSSIFGSAGDPGSDAGVVVALGDREVVAGLEVQPELGAGAEVASEAKRRVRADRASAVQDLGDPPRGQAERQGQAVGRHRAHRKLAPQDANR
jgi:hypothetical protein